LAIDQGTSGTKALVLDPVDGVLATVEVAVAPSYLHDGRVEQDPVALLESVLSAGREAVRQAGRPVGTVALANQGETVLSWDQPTGLPTSAAIVWQDNRAAEICRSMTEDADWISQRTGLVLDPYFSAPKMAWLRRNHSAAGVVTTTDTYLLHHLTGQFVTDAATASRSLLMDLDSASWDTELLAAFGLENELLPRIVANDQIIGSTTAFGSKMSVAGVILDQPAALFAQDCRLPGAAKCTFGTGAFLLANTGKAATRSTSGLTTSLAWSLAGRRDYCIDGQVFTVASAVRWMIGLGLLSSAAELDTVIAALSTPSTSPGSPDARGVFCVPSLAGLAAPWWRPDATASFTGMTLSTGSAELILAVLQGIAAQVAMLTASIAGDFGSPLTVLRVDGGLSRSTALMQAVADITQLPVEVASSPHATALGAAAMGLLAHHPGLDLRAIIRNPVSARYEPRWTTEHSQEFLARWHHIAMSTVPHLPQGSA